MRISEHISRFEKVIVAILSIMMAVVIALATLDLGWALVESILSPPVLLLSVQELIDIFGLFMLILIGIELLETIRIYHAERVIRVEVVIIVALIALARKAITLNYKQLTSFTLLELGVLTVALAVAFYLLKRSEEGGSDKQK